MKVSIIIICDQIRQEKLDRLLASLKTQLNPSVEVLLIHESNASQEIPTLAVPVRYITIPEKQGIPYNRNQGIANAQGDIVVFIDDDCWVSGNWLESLLHPLFGDKEVLAATT